MRTIRLWIVLLFVVGAVHMMGQSAEADWRPLSRSCGVIGIQESVTWDPEAFFGRAPYRQAKAISRHFLWDSSVNAYVFQHRINSGWQYNWRALAQHTGEFWMFGKVRGLHRVKLPVGPGETFRIVRLDRTVTTTCIDIDHPW